MAIPTRYFLVGLIALYVCSWGAPDAAAYNGTTELSYWEDYLSGYSGTWRDYWDLDQSYCLEWVLEPGGEYYYCSHYRWLHIWISVGATLYSPSAVPFYQDAWTYDYATWVAYDGPVSEYGTWSAYAAHYVGWDAWDGYCTPEGCGDPVYYQYTDWVLLGTSDAHVEATQTMMRELTYIGWDPNYVVVTPTSEGCYAVIFDSQVPFADFSWVHDGFGGGEEYGWPNGAIGCVYPNDPWWYYGLYYITSAIASGGNVVIYPNNATIEIISQVPPTITGMSPAGAARGSSGTLTMSGFNLDFAFISGCAALGLGSSSASSTSVSASYSIAASVSPGNCQLMVTGLGGWAYATFNIADATPVISSITPGSAPKGGTVTVTISGTGFGANPLLNVAGIPATIIPPSTDTQIIAIFNLENAAEGPHDLTVTSRGLSGSGFIALPGQQPNSTSAVAQFSVTLPVVLQVLVNGNVISNLSTAYIGVDAMGNPVMPTLAARLVSQGALTGIAAWTLAITYTGPDNVQYYSDTFVPPGGTKPANETWDITTGGVLGGLATVTVHYGTTWSSQRSFYLRGDPNYPTPTQAQVFTNSVAGQWWFLRLMASWETSGGACVSGPSGYHQFDSTGSPCFGAPHGFGMMQIDPPTGTNQPVRGVLWNYQTNVAAAIYELNAKAFTDPVPGSPGTWGAYHFWSRPNFGGGQLEQWLQWNANNPTRQVGAPTGPNATPGASCSFGLNLDGTVPAGSHSWADAILIKMYNGAPTNYIFWNNVTDPTNPQWGYNPTTPQSGNYVQHVCTQP